MAATLQRKIRGTVNDATPADPTKKRQISKTTSTNLRSPAPVLIPGMLSYWPGRYPPGIITGHQRAQCEPQPSLGLPCPGSFCRTDATHVPALKKPAEMPQDRAPVKRTSNDENDSLIITNNVQPHLYRFWVDVLREQQQLRSGSQC